MAAKTGLQYIHLSEEDRKKIQAVKELLNKLALEHLSREKPNVESVGTLGDLIVYTINNTSGLEDISSYHTVSVSNKLKCMLCAEGCAIRRGRGGFTDTAVSTESVDDKKVNLLIAIVEKKTIDRLLPLPVTISKAASTIIKVAFLRHVDKKT